MIGFAHGWAKVRRIHFADYGEGEKMLFPHIGWISGRLLSASLVHLPVASPAAAARASSRPDLEEVVVEAIDDCRGSAAHVTARMPDGRRVTGWTADLCANQATTCA